MLIIANVGNYDKNEDDKEIRNKMSEWLSGDFRKDLNKEYLGHWDLPEGEDLILTIEGVKMGDVRSQRGTEQKPVLYFKEKGWKPLILNVTNQKNITKALGTPKREYWRNKQISLYEGKEPKADDGLAVRIRDYAPKVESYTCEDCGKVITDQGGFKAAKIANQALTKFGAYLCMDCAKARKEADMP